MGQHLMSVVKVRHLCYYEAEYMQKKQVFSLIAAETL